MNVKKTADAMSERDEIEALLPWYVSGRLDPNLRARVERYLELHPDLAHHVELVREEAHAAILANEAIDPPGHRALERLRASIAASPRRTPLSTVLGGWRDSVMDWIGALAPPQLAMAAAAAALVVLVQATTIGALMMERARGPVYETAAGSEERAGDSVEMLVGFSDKATVGEINALLKALDGAVIDGPRSGFYRVRVPAMDAEDRGRGTALRALQQSGIVTVVLPSQ